MEKHIVNIKNLIIPLVVLVMASCSTVPDWQQIGNTIRIDSTERIVFPIDFKFNSNGTIVLSKTLISQDSTFVSYIETLGLDNRIWKVKNTFRTEGNYSFVNPLESMIHYRFNHLIDLSQDGNKLVVEKAYSLSDESMAYVLEDTTWRLLENDLDSVNNLDGGYNNRRKHSLLSKDGNTLVIAYSPPFNEYCVSIYLYQWGSGQWLKTGKTLQLPHSVPFSEVGITFCMNASGNLFAIGISDDNTNGPHAGKVFVFKKNDQELQPVGEPIYGSNPHSYLGRYLKFTPDDDLYIGIIPNEGEVEVSRSIFKYSDHKWVNNSEYLKQRHYYTSMYPNMWGEDESGNTTVEVEEDRQNDEALIKIFDFLDGDRKQTGKILIKGKVRIRNIFIDSEANRIVISYDDGYLNDIGLKVFERPYTLESV